jgi:hypothetical protein
MIQGFDWLNPEAVAHKLLDEWQTPKCRHSFVSGAGCLAHSADMGNADCVG